MLPGMTPVMMAGGQSAGGVTPDAVSFDDINGAGAGFGVTNTQTITGIGSPIYLRAEMSGTLVGLGGSGTLYAYVNGGLAGSAGIADSAMIDFAVSADDDVFFSADGSGGTGWSVETAVALKYKSAGSPTFDQTLDSFDVTLSL